MHSGPGVLSAAQMAAGRDDDDDDEPVADERVGGEEKGDEEESPLRPRQLDRAEEGAPSLRRIAASVHPRCSHT